MAKTATEASISLDYPRENETIKTPQYTFRVATSQDAELTEISIDQGPWHACRRSVGYWWYDWSGYGSGEHQAAVRGRLRGGGTESTHPRRFRVELGGGESRGLTQSPGSRSQPQEGQRIPTEPRRPMP